MGKIKSVIAKFKRYSKEGIWILVGQVMAITGSIASVKLLTAYLPPLEYGNLFLSLTIVTFGSQFLFGPIIQSSMRMFQPSVEMNRFALFVKTTKYFFKNSVIIFSFLIAIAIGYIVLFEESVQWIALLLLAGIYALLNAFNVNLDQIQNAARERVVVAWHSGLSSWVKVLLAYAFMNLYGFNAIVVMISYIISHTVVFLSQNYFFQIKIKHNLLQNDIGYSEHDKLKLRKKFKDYGKPFILWGLFAWLQQASDRWILKFYHGEEAIAFFMVIYQLGYKPATIGSKILTKFLAPILFEKAGDATDEARNKRVSVINLKVILFALFVAFIGFLFTLFSYDWIFELFVDERYWKYAYMLPYMVLAGGFFTATQLSNLSIMSRMASNKLLVPTIVSSIGCVGLYAILSRVYSVEGIVYSYLIFSIIQFAWIMIIKLRMNNDK